MPPEAASAPGWRRHSGTGLKIALGAGLLWLLHDKGLLDPSRIAGALADHPLWVACAVGLHGLIFVGIGMRWRFVAKAGRIAIPASSAQKLTFISHFFSTCLPGNGAGDLVKGVLLSRNGIPFSDVLGTMAVDRVAGMAGLFLAWSACLGAAAALHPQARPLLLATLPFSLGIAALLLASLYATAPLAGLANRIVSRLPQRGLLGRVAAESRTTLERMAHCTAHPGTTTAAVTFSIGIQLLLFLVAQCAARSLSIPLGLFEAGAVLPLASLANALPLSPGGIGVGETAASLAFSQLGLPANSGAELMLVVRVALVAWAVLGGCVYAFTSVSSHRASLTGSGERQ